MKMKIKSNKSWRYRNMTLTELMFAVTLGALLISLAYPIIITAMQQTKAGTWQAVFIDETRQAQQKINKTVQSQKFLHLRDEHTVELYSIDGDQSLLFYDTEGEHLKNAIVLETPDSTDVLCRYVNPISDTEPIFDVVWNSTNSRKWLRVALHVGDSPEEDEQKYETGPGYQGVELRFTASPRNLQRWYDF